MTALRTILGTAAVLAALVAAPATGLAQGTDEQRAACTGDAFKFCSAHIPNIPAITTCMKANYSKLSPGCKAAANKG